MAPTHTAACLEADQKYQTAMAAWLGGCIVIDTEKSQSWRSEVTEPADVTMREIDAVGQLSLEDNRREVILVQTLPAIGRIKVDAEDFQGGVRFQAGDDCRHVEGTVTHSYPPGFFHTHLV